MDKQMLGIINAGEENRKLKDLVRSRSLSALPVGGRYRTVDFMLSNMVNAGIKNVGLLTRRNYDSLLSHVNSGKDWGLNKKRGGLYIFPPYINDASPSGEYASVMDGLRGTLGFLKKAKEKYVLLGRSYVICNADFQDMLDKHIKSGADITLVRKMFRDDMEGYRAKAAIISSAEVYQKKFAIATGADLHVESPTIIGAQAANELLDISAIKASFVLTEYNGRIYVSARSIDEVNVQIIMERLGGGGHMNASGAQFNHTDMDEAVACLKQVIDEMIEGGDL